jgi:hypothetical protein
MAARGYPSHSELYAAGNGSTLTLETELSQSSSISATTILLAST